MEYVYCMPKWSHSRFYEIKLLINISIYWYIKFIKTVPPSVLYFYSCVTKETLTLKNFSDHIENTHLKRQTDSSTHEPTFKSDSSWFLLGFVFKRQSPKYVWFSHQDPWIIPRNLWNTNTPYLAKLKKVMKLLPESAPLSRSLPTCKEFTLGTRPRPSTSFCGNLFHSFYAI